MSDSDYSMIFKRKSFHRYLGTGRLEQEELREIKRRWRHFTPLLEGIQTQMRIVPRTQTTCKRGEYCILLYSEPAQGYLENVGYMGEQLDLWLASRDIGACWYGMGKTMDAAPPGMEFVIMLSIQKEEPQHFRRDVTKARRKPLEELWVGQPWPKVASVVRYAPSACNTQPWQVQFRGNELQVRRISGKRSMMPAEKVPVYNRIDIGIFLLFLELCLEQEQAPYRRTFYPDAGSGEVVAVYHILCPAQEGTAQADARPSV